MTESSVNRLIGSASLFREEVHLAAFGYETEDIFRAFQGADEKLGNRNGYVSGQEIIDYFDTTMLDTLKNECLALFYNRVGMKHTISMTPPDVEGPYYREGAPSSWKPYMDIRGDQVGETLIISGHVLGTDGFRVPNATVEIWQANNGGQAAGMSDQAQYDNSQESGAFQDMFLRGKVRTDHEGRFTFSTIRAGRYDAGGELGLRPGHHHFKITAPGYEAPVYNPNAQAGQEPQMSDVLITQMYLHDDEYNQNDPFYNPENEARVRRMRVLDKGGYGNTLNMWQAQFNFVLQKKLEQPSAADVESE